MKIQDKVLYLIVTLSILIMTSCMTEKMSPEEKALNEIVSQHYSQSIIHTDLIPFDQSPIPSTEQLRVKNKESIAALTAQNASHLPKSIRIPDPMIRALADQKIVDINEMQVLLNELSTRRNKNVLNFKNVIDFNQSYEILDSLGFDVIEAFTHPILINDKLFVVQMNTSQIQDYQSENPKQLILFKVYQKMKPEETDSEWEQIFEKKIR